MRIAASGSALSPPAGSATVLGYLWPSVLLLLFRRPACSGQVDQKGKDNESTAISFYT